MKIFMVGSFHANIKDIGYFQELCRDIGYIGSKYGHVLILGSDTQNTADYYIFQGVSEYLAEHEDASVKISVHRPNWEKDLLPFRQSRLPNLAIDYTLYPAKIPFEKAFKEEAEITSHKGYDSYVWAPAHVGSIATADVVVLIGGATHTRRVAELARAINVLTSPIPISGGASQELFNRFHNDFEKHLAKKVGLDFEHALWRREAEVEIFYKYLRALVNSGQSRYRPFDPADSIEEKDFGPVYFMSYSHENKLDCDQIELLLRKNNRVVVRDEDSVRSGDKIKERTKDLIAQCDFFIVVLSNSYCGSNYCMYEYETARGMNKNIRFLLVGSESSSDKLCKDYKHTRAKTWEEKIASVTSLISNEHS